MSLLASLSSAIFDRPGGESRSAPSYYGAQSGYIAGPSYLDAFKAKRAPSAWELVEQYKSLIYACVQLNWMGVTRVPLRLYTDSSKGNRPRDVSGPRSINRTAFNHLQRSGYIQRSSATKDDVQEITSHPTIDALDHPDSEGYFSREDVLGLAAAPVRPRAGLLRRPQHPLFYRDDDGFHVMSSASGSHFSKGTPRRSALCARLPHDRSGGARIASGNVKSLAWGPRTGLLRRLGSTARRGQFRSISPTSNTKLRQASEAVSRFPIDLPSGWVTAAVSFDAANLPPPASGMGMLGVFLSSPAYVEARLPRKLAKVTAVLEGEAWHMLEPRVQLPSASSLSASSTPSFRSGVRTTRPALLGRTSSTPLSGMDKAIVGAFSSIVGFLPCHTNADVNTLELLRLSVRLPLKMELVGLRLLQDASLPAYISSLLDGRTIALARQSCTAGHRHAEVALL